MVSKEIIHPLLLYAAISIIGARLGKGAGSTGLPANYLSAERFDEDTSFGLTHSDPVISDADRSLLGFFKMNSSPINPLIAVEAKVRSLTFTLFMP